MAATTAAAIKVHLEGLGLGIPVHRDRPPPGAARPYVTVTEAVAVTPRPLGDFGDQAVEMYVDELAQVDVWQTWRDPETRAVVESYALPGVIGRSLQGARLPAAPTRVLGVSLDSSVRLLEDEENVVHHALTVRIRRVL